MTQRAYALAMAGMPGLLVADVFCGAHVMTVTVSSPEPPEIPGTTPQAAARDAQATRAPVAIRAVLTRGVAVLRTAPGALGLVGEELVRRLPVMDTHDSPTSLTLVRSVVN
ncbi:hypothetical protein GCM10022207_07650 [Streptomyces lannensis]|uniref:Uncharacterized protein n=1 Tax=Streptomyces lannensis TaxID=766498 RepID=A0ABP7JM83_9ACTN